MKNRILSALAITLLALSTAACWDEPDGPFEEAGEKVDNAVENAGEAIEETGDTIRDKTQ
ncbi:MAG: hypothetical protein ACPGU7_10405 [Gammaproteobacteria bacterium]